MLRAGDYVTAIRRVSKTRAPYRRQYIFPSSHRLLFLSWIFIMQLFCDSGRLTASTLY